MHASTTYLFALVDGGGTVPPELGAVRRLVLRGHRVTVLADSSMTDDVAATGAEFRPWTSAPNRLTRRPEDDPLRDWECANPLALFAQLLDRQFVGPAPAYASDTAAAIDELRPHLVVCSFFAIGAMTAAEAAGVPFDVLMPNVYMLPAPGMPPFGLGLSPANGALGRVRDAIVTRVSARQWNKGLPRLNSLRTSLGLDPVESFFAQVGRARRQLVMTSRAFDFPAELDPAVRYVGAVLDDPAWATGQPWAPPAGEGPLVLVALSSTFQDHLGTLQRIIDALADLPVRAIVTTGPSIGPDELIAPANVSVVSAAPHSEILRHAAAVVTHGGHGTVVRSLAAGVPMLVVPHGRDQADNAIRVSSRRAGITVKRGARPRRIAAALERLLVDPSYRSGAAELGRAIRADASGTALIDELESVRADVAVGDLTPT